MNHKLTGNTHLFDPAHHTMFTGKLHIMLNEDDPSAPFAELHVSDEESHGKKVFRYTDPAQIAVLTDLLIAVETTHTSFVLPVAEAAAH